MDLEESFSSLHDDNEEDYHDDYNNNHRDKFSYNRNAIVSYIQKIPPLLFIPAIVTMMLYLYSVVMAIPIHHHDHTIPTLLAVQTDALTQGNSNSNSNSNSNNNSNDTMYVNSLMNTLYEEMKHAHFDTHDMDMIYNMTTTTTTTTTTTNTTTSITTENKDFLSFHDDLTLSWEFVGDDDGSGGGSGINDNNIEHVIALYCPATEQNPKKFKDAATIAQIRTTNLMAVKKKKKKKKDNDESIFTTTTSSSASAVENKWYIPSLPIIREETCEFRYWIRGHDEYHLDSDGYQIPNYKLAGKKEFHIDHGMTQPTTIHLAFTTDASQMMVQFSTGAPGIPIVAYHPDADIVRSGDVEKGLYMNNKNGTSTTYHAEDMCQEPANLKEPGKFSSPGMLHSISMPNLEYNKTYYYKVGIMEHQAGLIGMENIKDIVWSEVYSFDSPIPPASDATTTTTVSHPFTFIVYAGKMMKNNWNNNMLLLHDDSHNHNMHLTPLLSK